MPQKLEISRPVEWDMGHRIPNHESGCRHLHGHRYRLEVSVGGELIGVAGSSSEGMLLDFSVLKTVLQREVHAVLDHRCLLWDQDPLLTLLPEPQRWGIVAVDFIPTAENIMLWLQPRLVAAFERHGVTLTAMRLYETPNAWVDRRILPHT